MQLTARDLTLQAPLLCTARSINERVARLANWIETRFSVKATSAKADVLEAFFLCLRDRQPLVLKVHPVNNQVQVGSHLRNHHNR